VDALRQRLRAELAARGPAGRGARAAACGARLVAFDCPGGTREIVSAIPGAQLVGDGDVRGFARALARALGPEPPPRARLPEESGWPV